MTNLEKALGGRCECTHEAGDSDCAVHPRCPCCGVDLADTKLAAEVLRLRAREARVRALLVHLDAPLWDAPWEDALEVLVDAVRGELTRSHS